MESERKQADTGAADERWTERVFWTERAFSLAWGAGLVLLLTVSWPLWQLASEIQDPDAFPRVGWLSVNESVAWLIHWAGAGLLAIGLVGLATTVFRSDCQHGVARSWASIAVGLALLVVLDQHRLQPWAYQTILYAMLLAGLPWFKARRWIMATGISIYFYSAAGKFDYQFAHTVGSDIVRGMMVLSGASSNAVSETTVTRLAFGLPAGELMVAVLLMIPRTRAWGGWAAIGLHATLILLLGPWWFDHSGGVLVWNALLAAQAWLIFVRPLQVVRDTNSTAPESNANRFSAVALFVQSIALAALLLPLLERRGYWDHWTSWALYSPHNSRVDAMLHRTTVDELPESLHAFVIEDEDDDGWHRLDLENWSLEQRQVPLYPQARYQLGLVQKLAQRYQWADGVRVQTKSSSDRWTGERAEQFLFRQREIDKAMEQYWVGIK